MFNQQYQQPENTVYWDADANQYYTLNNGANAGFNNYFMGNPMFSGMAQGQRNYLGAVLGGANNKSMVEEMMANKTPYQYNVPSLSNMFPSLYNDGNSGGMLGVAYRQSLANSSNPSPFGNQIMNGVGNYLSSITGKPFNPSGMSNSSAVDSMSSNRQPYQYNVPSLASLFPSMQGATQAAAMPQGNSGAGRFMNGLLGSMPTPVLSTTTQAPSTSGAGRFL